MVGVKHLPQRDFLNLGSHKAVRQSLSLLLAKEGKIRRLLRGVCEHQALFLTRTFKAGYASIGYCGPARPQCLYHRVNLIAILNTAAPLRT